MRTDKVPTQQPAILVVIPALDEGSGIARVIAEIRGLYDFPIAVIDDASSDDTAAEARRAGATVLPLAARLGAWGAMQAGIRFAQRHRFDYVITMDADGQHEAESLKDILSPVLEGRANVCIGACTSRGSRLRKFAWVLMKHVSGLSLEDITSGLRAYDRAAIDLLSRRRATLLDYQDVGVLLLLQSRGLRVMDIEVSMRDRQHGASRVFSSWLVVLYYMSQTLLLGLTKRRLREQTGRNTRRQ